MCVCGTGKLRNRLRCTAFVVFMIRDLGMLNVVFGLGILCYKVVFGQKLCTQMHIVWPCWWCHHCGHSECYICTFSTRL